MNTTRRAVLGATALLPVAALLGCANSTETQDQTDIQAIAPGLSGVLTELQALPSTASLTSAIGMVQTELTVIDNDAATFAAALTPSATVAQDIVNAVNAIGAAATPFFPEAAAIVPIIDAAVAVAQAVVTDVSGTTTTASAAAPVYVPRVRYTRAAGRLILRGAAKGK